MKAAQELLSAAIASDGDAQRSLLAGDEPAARDAFSAASEFYRRSWEQAPPHSYGRLVGMLKDAILAGAGERAAAGFAREALEGDQDATESATAAYARALAALIEEDDGAARERSEVMRGGGGAFERTATAIAALADRDAQRYAAAVSEIVADFEHRSAHLTGVAIADTALMLERLAAPRGLAAGVRSELL